MRITRRRQTIQLLLAFLRLLQPRAVTSISRGGSNRLAMEDHDDANDDEMHMEDMAEDYSAAEENGDHYYEEAEDGGEDENLLYDDGFIMNVLEMSDDEFNDYEEYHDEDVVEYDDFGDAADQTNDGFVVAQPKHSWEGSSSPPPSSPPSPLPDCGVYYAESTIPGAGFGIFAGRNFKPGDEVTPGDLAVPTVDLPWHYGYGDDYEYSFLWNEYNWDTSGFPFMEDEGLSVSSSSFGVGALPNCFFPLINLEDTKTMIDTAGLHRSRDVGSGAFTPYHNRRGKALVDIPAGMELFVDYGESYFDTRQEQFGPVPLPHHYHMGNQFLHRYADFIKFLLTRRHDVCRHEGFCPRSDLHSSVYNVVHDIKDIWESRILNALPLDPSRLEEMLEKGTESTHYNRSIRDIQWLEEHGTCMDNLYAGHSSIRQAGRGALARKSIKKGEIVTPGPLIHVPAREMFTMYQETPGRHPHSRNRVRNEDAPIHEQLLLNYCFGHADSSILLCPYGITSNLINHSKERANAKVVWSTKSMRKPEWLEQPPSEWAESLFAGLAFDYMAIKDIAAGDEVFISYGDDWERAWNEHVNKFAKAPGRSPFYTPAYELDAQMDSTIKTMAEGSYGSKEVQLQCHEEYRLLRGLWPDEPDMTKHPCRAIYRYLTERGEYRYWVEILEHEDMEMDSNGQCYEHMAEIMFDVPRDAFTFSDAFGARDHGQPWSFRHYIGIPDEIMPVAWLDKKTIA